MIRFAEWVLTIMLLALVALLLTALGRAAFAQEHDHGLYHRACCSPADVTTGEGDCDPVPASAVRAVPGGFHVTLDPGDHPDVTQHHEWFVTYEDLMTQGSKMTKVQLSKNEEWHVCLYPNEDTLRCLYIVVGGA
jgi:hypothetical protein